MPRKVQKQVDKIPPNQKGKKITKGKKNDENKSQRDRIEDEQNINDALIDIKNNQQPDDQQKNSAQQDSVFNNGQIEENNIQNVPLNQGNQPQSLDEEFRERNEGVGKQDQKEEDGDDIWKQNSNQNSSQNQEQYDQQQQQSQNQQSLHQNQLSSPSHPIIPAIKTMQYRKIRGTRIQGLIEGKIKIDDGVLANQVNQYLGVKIKPKDQNGQSQRKSKKNQSNQNQKDNLKSQDSEAQHSIYNYNEQDSSDREDYIQSSSGRDQFDSDFDYTDSYPGKRGRKKGSRGRKRGRGRSKVIDNGQQRPHRKRGRPRKVRPQNQNINNNGSNNSPNQGEERENPSKKRRGRPRKNQQNSQNIPKYKLNQYEMRINNVDVIQPFIANQIIKNQTYPTFQYPMPQIFDSSNRFPQNYGLLMNPINLTYPMHGYPINSNTFNNQNQDLDIFFGDVNKDDKNDIKQIHQQQKKES